MSDEKDLLSQELRRRSADIGGHPVGIDAVRERARAIRRRRRVVTGAVAAVVAALAVPTGLTVSHELTTVGGPAHPPVATHSSTTPTPTPAPAREPTPVGDVVLRLEGLRRGAVPAIPYVVGSLLHRPDDTTLPLDREYQSLVPFQGGWIGLAFAAGEWRVDHLDGNGRQISSVPGSDPLAVSSDGQRVAWFSPDPHGAGTLTLEGPGAERFTWRTPQGEQVHPLGMVDDSTVVVETYGTAPKVELAMPDGRLRVVPGLVAAGGASDASGLVAGQTSSSDTGSCWTVLEPLHARTRWDTCDFALGRLSPDGRYVVGTEAYGDGPGGGEVALIDLASGGKEMTRFAKAKTDPLIVASPVVWEDDSHVLAEVFRDGAWTVVRLGLDGSMELAAGPVPGEDAVPAVHFGARP